MTSKYKIQWGKNKIYSVKVQNDTPLALCSASNLCAREKTKRTFVQADSQGHFSYYHELMSPVWPVNAYFLICFSENSEKYIEVDSIICILTTYKHNQDVLELKEEELILLQDEIQQTSDVLTLTEATEISADEPEVMRHSSRRRKRRFAEDYLYYD